MHGSAHGMPAAGTCGVLTCNFVFGSCPTGALWSMRLSRRFLLRAQRSYQWRAPLKKVGSHALVPTPLCALSGNNCRSDVMSASNPPAPSSVVTPPFHPVTCCHYTVAFSESIRLSAHQHPVLTLALHHSCSPAPTLLPPTPTPDPEYQAFVKEYEEGPRPAPTAQALLEAHEAARAAEEAKGPIVTALMAFLQQKYEAGSSLGGRRGARGARSSGSGTGSRREAGGRLSTVEEVSIVNKVRCGA